MSDRVPAVPRPTGANRPSARDLPAPPTLDDLLCFDLYATSRALTSAYRPLLAEFDITYPQYLVLVVLGGVDAVLIKDVAAQLHLDHATLSPLLGRMEARGLLVRERDRDDQRAVLVRLTEQGRDVHARFGLVHCRLAETLGLEPSEIAELQQLLGRIGAGLAQASRGA
ncbi:MarR family winged helix-turn-helix transcriptional regulator [Nocardioides sp.]|uniref:MarR family winged helix-turn-helix transcriptional regulator n=1 Tax=Nocardioides sp. TaxID=35761 RepID=UPI003516CDA4